MSCLLLFLKINFQTIRSIKAQLNWGKREQRSFSRKVMIKRVENGENVNILKRG